jgi:hypothetical protein
LPSTRDEKIVNPYFKKFSEGTLHQVAASGAAPAADFRIRSRLLAEEIPALSWPAGSQPVNGFAKTDLVTLWKHPEGLAGIRLRMSDGKPEWNHSDITAISYLHTHRFFEQMVTLGNLK